MMHCGTSSPRAALAGVTAWRGGDGRGGTRALAVASARPGARFGAQSEPRASYRTSFGRKKAGGRGTVRGRAFQEHTGAEASDMDARKRLLQRYVEEVDPQSMEAFTEQAPPEVVKAMKETVTNMLGTLPPQFFDVTISTVGENLAQLMYSLLMTGYMFRNAQYRLELQQSMFALPGGVGDVYASGAGAGAGEGEPGVVTYAPGTQRKGVQGSVVRWNQSSDAPEECEVGEYLDRLEAELEMLRGQLERERRAGVDRNQILEYLKGLEPHNIQELTSSAGSDVLEAMNAFIARLVGTADEAELKEQPSESTSAEMARLLYWLLVVGYSLRTMEVRLDMQRSVGLPPAMASEPNGLPPGI